MPAPNELFQHTPDASKAPFLASVHARWLTAVRGGGDALADRAIRALNENGHLDAETSRAVMERITAGEESDETVGALLVCTAPDRVAPETIASFASVMRERAHRIVPAVAAPLVDTCGTGGDSFKTVNVSTAASVVIASAGLNVAKHGNRGITSGCGSADVLAALGVNVELDPPQVQKVLEEVGIAFLFAPRFHPAMKHVQPTRKRLAADGAALGMKLTTVFNVLGPLTNPAGATHQVLGVMARELVLPVATALAQLGVTRALVVHGEGPNGEGMDELSPFGRTHAAEVAGQQVTEHQFDAAALGVAEVDPSQVQPGADPPANAERLRGLLGGAEDAARELVALNAGVALWIAGKADDAKTGVTLAREELKSGRPLGCLERFAAATQRAGA